MHDFLGKQSAYIGPRVITPFMRMVLVSIYETAEDCSKTFRTHAVDIGLFIDGLPYGDVSRKGFHGDFCFLISHTAVRSFCSVTRK